MAKTKVAPINRLSIPPLELCCGTILAKLLNHLAHTLGIESSVFCLDSQLYSARMVVRKPETV